jgi:hypothetical protein
MATVTIEVDEHLFALRDITFGQNKAPHGFPLFTAGRQDEQDD